MKNFSILIKVLKYIKNNKKFKVEKINSKFIKTEYTVICILILILLIHLYLKRDLKATLVLFSVFLVIYNTIYILNFSRNVQNYIDDKFEMKIEVINLKRKEKMKLKSKINRIILLDELGNDKKIYEMNKNEFIIGKVSRNNNVDIDLKGFLNDGYVSRRHARIFKKDDAFYISDEGSTNGTDILKNNNRKINLKSFEIEKLEIGDYILIKDIKMLVN